MNERNLSAPVFALGPTSPFRGGFFIFPQPLPPLKGEIVSHTLPARGNGDREAVERS